MITPSTHSPDELYRHIRGQLAADVVGHRDVVRKLSLVAMRHMLGHEMQRVTLVGPPGVGKTTLVKSLAETIDLPHLMISVSELAETNWKGQGLPEHIRSLRRRVEEQGRRYQMDRALVFLDEIDKAARLPGEDGNAASYHLGKQQSLLNLLGGDTEIHYSLDGDEMKTKGWSAERALVISAGVFDGLEGPPTRTSLIDYGFAPELVSRLGLICPLRPLAPGQLVEVLKREVSGLADTYRQCDYELEISEDAYLRVAERVSREDIDGGPRTGANWLRDAGTRGLIELLERKASRGTSWSLTPAELDLPRRESSRGIGFQP